MTNEIQQSTTIETKPPAPFGTRLKAAREAMGLDRKDAAAQLRLNEKFIIMMEKDRYPVDLPVTFIRGYIRAYGKLLHIPEHEIKKAIEPIKPKAVQQEAAGNPKQATPVTSGNYFMQFFTYLIVITMVALVAVWWYTHSTPPVSRALNIPENKLNPLPNGLRNQQATVVGIDAMPNAPVATTASRLAEKKVEDQQQSPNLNTTPKKASPLQSAEHGQARVSQREADPYADSDDLEPNSNDAD